MIELLWLIVALPFSGALILALLGKKLPRSVIAVIGVGSVSLAAIITILIGISFINNSPGVPFVQKIAQWINTGGLSTQIAFHLDSVSLIFIFVITFVGALIHLYSAEFMWKEEGFSRFFTYMNLFIGFMLILVLADNLLLLYLGWEGVGLCSYLLIGFWYKNPDNGYAARKAFIVTRVGDTALAIAFFILFMTFGTLNISEILAVAPDFWNTGNGMAVAMALLLLGGAVGKSAQLPLQTWLPDAMAGPSPVSALIHAATMVTAGVYLIARTNVLFQLAPIAQTIVAVVGALTLLMAGFSALNQHDIKRVLAYSTISQIGYMFLALGVGAWSAAIFHFMIHAFFKALLFLGAGVIILAMQHEHNMFKMGGLRKKMPVVFWTFLIAAGSLSALPLVTAGYFSKDKILWLAFAGENGSVLLWLAGLAGAFITALYTFRMVFITFYGEVKKEPTQHPGIQMTIPLVILAILSFAGGYIELPENMGNFALFSDFTKNTLPAVSREYVGHSLEFIFQLIAAVVAIAGVFAAYKLYYKKSFPAAEPERNTWEHFFFKGWNFDLAYNKLFVEPYVRLSKLNKNDFVDKFYNGLASATKSLNRLLSATQNGSVRWYAMVVAIGAIITLTILFY